MLAVRDLCFATLRVAFVYVPTFVLQLGNVYLLATIYESSMPISPVSSAVLPFPRRSLQFGSGICKDFQVNHLSLSQNFHFSSKNKRSLFVASLQSRPSKWPIVQFSLAMFSTKLKKALASLRSASRHVPKLLCSLFLSHA